MLRRLVSIGKRVRGLERSFSAWLYKTDDNVSTRKCYEYLNDIHKDARSSAVRRSIKEFSEPQSDVSVIMTTYNREELVERCIQSIISQKTRFNVQYIFVNDGSRDRTKDILEKYREYPNVTIINQENTGVSGARNAAIDASTGKYIMFVDDDDTLAENALENLLEVALDGGYDIVQGAMRTVRNGRGIVTGCQGEIKPLMGNLQGFAAGKLYNRKIFEKIVFPSRYWFEDSINSALIYRNSLTAFGIDKVVYNYCYTEGSITDSYKNPKNLDSLYITNQLLKDRKTLNLPFEQENYEYFLRMVNLTYQRTRFFDNDVRYAIFQMQRYLYNKYFVGFHTEKTNYLIKIEKSFVQNNFTQYVKACELHI